MFIILGPHHTFIHIQAKHHCPLLTCPGANVGLKRRIVQQFIGVLDHSRGYILYRRLPVVSKGANVTCSILVDMIANGHLKRKTRLCLQWDGGPENVAYTNIRFCVWLLLQCMFAHVTRLLPVV